MSKPVFALVAFGSRVFPEAANLPLARANILRDARRPFWRISALMAKAVIPVAGGSIDECGTPARAGRECLPAGGMFHGRSHDRLGAVPFGGCCPGGGIRQLRDLSPEA